MTANADAMSVENDLLTAQAPSIGAEPWRTRYEAGKRVDFLQPLHKFFFNLIRTRVHRSGCRNGIRSHVQYPRVSQVKFKFKFMSTVKRHRGSRDTGTVVVSSLQVAQDVLEDRRGSFQTDRGGAFVNSRVAARPDDLGSSASLCCPPPTCCT